MGSSGAKYGLGLLILSALAATASAEQGPRNAARIATSSRPARAQHSPRLLTRDEGQAIIGAALDTRRASGDCSHIVHSIYQKAGFPYRYADSKDLYTGIPGFRKVLHPQPGDLAVWPGHAAIVVNPAQHSFFGGTGSGLRVESYDLAYWKHRGPPRFFRYLKPTPVSIRSAGKTRDAKLALAHQPPSP